MATRLPSVVLVGRPNVGKSTLFNRLTGKRRAIVTPIPGTTRDVIAHPAEWQGARFTVVDTGGMFGASEDPLHELVLERGHRAIADADLLVLVVDGRAGTVPGDEQIADQKRQRPARPHLPQTLQEAHVSRVRFPQRRAEGLHHHLVAPCLLYTSDAADE